MLLMKSPTMAVYVSVWMHTLLQPVGEGEFTCENDKARFRGALCGLQFELVLLSERSTYTLRTHPHSLQV